MEEEFHQLAYRENTLNTVSRDSSTHRRTRAMISPISPIVGSCNHYEPIHSVLPYYYSYTVHRHNQGGRHHDRPKQFFAITIEKKFKIATDSPCSAILARLIYCQNPRSQRSISAYAQQIIYNTNSPDGRDF
jgi:hypothetical protein